MTDTLARRGPDDKGYFISTDESAGLGHRRLSIIDVSGGHQPLSSAGGQIQMIANCEIYNFVALRAELEGLGHSFRTNTDSEVIAHGFAAWGTDVFTRLEGMFAIAIWDERTRKLHLARDRMGKKPLYYAMSKDGFLFGSELKALAAHPEFDRTVSPQSLAKYLTYECFVEDTSVYRAANKLLPGHFLTLDQAQWTASTHEFWRMRFADNPLLPELANKSETELAAELRTRIRDATEARLVSDVPLGVFLSGGIDSSAVTAAMAQSVAGDRIKTFSISFADKSFDESSHARRVAHHLGTDHHERRLSPDLMIDILPEVAEFMCEPIGDASVIPTYLLSRFTRETVTVALGGDGGDELFLGYPTFQADQVAARLDRWLSPRATQRVAKMARWMAGSLPVSRKNFSLDFKAKRFAQGLSFPPDQRHQAWMGSFLPDALSDVLSEEVREEALREHPYSTIASLWSKTNPRDRFDRSTYQYARLYLTACVLVKVDRASMACGLEVRAPLLDTRVVDFASAIPGTLRIKGFSTKYLLKEAVRPWLPEDIIDRPKKGFGVPMADWLRGPLRDLAHDHLSMPKLRREGFFDPLEVNRLLDEHDRGAADHRKPLWTLLAFQLWLEQFGPQRLRRAPDAVDESSVELRAVG